MPTVIGRDELTTLTGQGAQLVEVLPAEDYAWARLPGSVNLPLKQLDTGTGQLRGRSGPRGPPQPGRRTASQQRRKKSCGVDNFPSWRRPCGPGLFPAHNRWTA